MEAAPSALIVVAGSIMRVNATITDVEDDSLLQGVLADIYFDWGGPSQVLMENRTTGSDGVATFNPVIPADTMPGYYSIRVHVPDDKSDNLTVPNAGRWLGNDSFVNLTRMLHEAEAALHDARTWYLSPNFGVRRALPGAPVQGSAKTCARRSRTKRRREAAREAEKNNKASIGPPSEHSAGPSVF